MSDEFMNGAGGENEYANEQPQAYSEPVHASESSQENDYSQPDYSQPQYDQNTFGGADYSHMNQNQNNYGQTDYSQNQNYYGQPNYNQNPNYNQQPYGQQYQQPGMATKNDGTGFGIASLVLGIISIFTGFCCINYILAILAIIFGIVQIVRSKQKGLAIGGIITAAISIVGATIFWIFVSVAGSSATDEMGPLQDYMEEYIEQNNDAF